jgi:hypothetical protein
MNTTKIKSMGIAALSAAVLFSGCGKINPNETLLTINTGDGTKDTISLGYGNFVARYQQAMYDQFLLSYYGESMWTSDMMGNGSTMQDDTKDGVIDDIESQYVAKLHASDYGIELTDEQKTAIQEAATKFMTDNPEDTIKVMGAKEEYVKQFLEYKTYYSLVEEAAEKEADADISEDDCWMRSFTYVLFSTTGTADESGAVTELSEDDIATLRENAKILSESDDFDATVEELGVTASTYSYLKGEEEDSTMDMSIISAAEKLSEGETEIVEVADAGYYVIRLDSDHDEDASASKRESLQSEAFKALLDSWKAEITWTVNEKAWAKVEFDTLFKALEKETEVPAEETDAE